MMTDPISDFLTRIRNGLMSEKEIVEMPASNLKLEMARILVEEGYIEAADVADAEVGRTLRVTLRYTGRRKPVITGLERVSRPGCRVYVRSAEVPRVLGGMGTTIISTSGGVMTGHDARRRGVGGEHLASIW
jgi:small subunit ribosomal protein S8